MNKGFSSFTLLSIVVSVLIIGGVFYIFYSHPGTTSAPASSSTVAPSPSPVGVQPSPTPTPGSQPTSTPVTASLSPSSGPVGTKVTIHGTGFVKTAGNTILMNGMVGAGFKNVASPDGKTLTFTVPQSLGPNCSASEMCAQYLIEVTNGKYPITVVTNGISQSFGNFTVTGGTSLQVNGQVQAQ